MRDCVFIHIGKTGGSSTRVYLAAAAFHNSGWRIHKQHRHLTAAAVREKLGAELFDNALRFAVVRHPVDRYISACRQCKVDANDPETWAKIRKGEHPSHGAEVTHHIFVTQVDSTFIDGKQSCEIFKFEEDLPDGLCAWLAAEGLGHPRFAHINPAPPETEKQELTAEALEFVKDFYARDFEEFGYEP